MQVLFTCAAVAVARPLLFSDVAVLVILFSDVAVLVTLLSARVPWQMSVWIWSKWWVCGFGRPARAVNWNRCIVGNVGQLTNQLAAELMSVIHLASLYEVRRAVFFFYSIRDEYLCKMLQGIILKFSH